MSEPFVVAFVPGVTPGKWSRLWAERMRREPLELRPLDGDAALGALHDGTVDMALVRDVDADDEVHVIPLYREQPVVVAPKDHPVTAFESVAIPPGAQPGTGADAHMAIWQPGTDTYWEFFHMRKLADGWHADYGGAMKDVSHSPGYFSTASWPGLSQLQGLVRPRARATRPGSAGAG